MSNDEITRRDLNKTAITAAALAGIGALGAGSGASAQSEQEDYYALARLVEGLEIPEEATVVGIGGHGSWPALFSAMSGVKSLLITDMGDVEALDIGRTPYRPSDIGRNKTEALSDIIKFFRPEIEILTNTRRLEPGESDIFHGQVLFNGVDYKPLEEWLAGAALEHGMKYVHGFYNGNKVGITTHRVPNLQYIPGREVPVWPGTAAMSGCMAVMAAFAKPMDYFGDIADISIGEQKLNELMGSDSGGA